jgi:hypothetical protein
MKVQAAHVRTKGMHGFPSLQANMQRNLAVKPCLRPPGTPLVLDGQSQLHPSASPSMNV